MIDQIYPSPDFLKVKTISPERRELLAKLGGLNVIKFATEKEEQWQAIYQHGLTNRSEEHTSELQSLMRISYAVFCLKKKNNNKVKIKNKTRPHNKKLRKQ